MFETKLQAINVCARLGIGVTLVPGVNTEELGNIIEFAKSMVPAVRGIHFQPV